MRWSGVRISGGSPKIAMTELGRSLLFFCVRRDTEIRTGFARRSRLRAPPSKVFSPRLRTAPIRSSALLAYLRWVTKTNTASMRRLFLFYAAGVRFERGSRGEAACAHRPQKCSRLVSAPPPSEALHYSHISGGSACTHRPQKCSRLVSAPPLSEALHYSHISGGSVYMPRRHRLARNRRGRCRSCGSSPWNAPPRERVPDDSGEPHYTRQSSALSSRLSKRQYRFAAPAAVLTGGRGEW